MSIELLELAAATLGELSDELVFVGGATVSLWITEPATPDVRATDDVDVICDVIGYADYERLAEKLREHDFGEDDTSNVICRWRHPSGLTLDVMPTDQQILGFSNRWYGRAIETSVERTLPSGAVIRATTPPMLIATKIEAWRGRGKGDVMKSLDVHDIVVLVNGRSELPEELRAEPTEVQEDIGRELRKLLGNPYLDYVVADALSGYGASAEDRRSIVRNRLQKLGPTR